MMQGGIKMNLPKLAINRPVSAILIVITIIVFGVYSVFSFSQELTPPMEMPMLVVNIAYPGANPQDVEKLVTKKLETAVGTLTGIKEVLSYSMENASMSLIQYRYGTDMREAQDDLKRRLDSYENEFPEGAMDPVIMEMNFIAQDSMTLIVSGEMEQGMLYSVENIVAPELERLSSVANVSIHGGEQEYIVMEPKDEYMKQYGIDIDQIIQYVKAADFNYPLGTIEMGEQVISVTSRVEYKTINDLEKLPITLDHGKVIYLSDVVDIYRSYEESENIGRYNGENIITLGIQKQQSSSSVDVSRDVYSVIKELSERYSGLDINVIYQESDMIENSINSVASALILSIVISMVILFLFYGDLKASLIVGSAIPISLLISLILMKLMNFTLNIITMSSLVIGVGMMVDNSIVVLDSCFAEYKDNVNIRDTAIIGAKKVAGSVLASTVTTCVVFLPLSFLQGISGQLFEALGLTIVFSMIASLISALTIVPLGYVFLRPRERTRAPLNGIATMCKTGYQKTMPYILTQKFLTVSISILLLFTAFNLVKRSKLELIPAMDSGIISIELEMKPGITDQKKLENIKIVEQLVASYDYVDYYLVSSDSGGMGVTAENIVNLKAYLLKERQLTTKEVVDIWTIETNRITDCEINVTSSSAISFGEVVGGSVLVDLKSSDYDSLKVASDQVVEILNNRTDLKKVNSTLGNAAPIISIGIDPIRAGAEGITPFQAAAKINYILDGVEVTKLNQNGVETEVRIEYPRDKKNLVENLSNLAIISGFNRTIPISNIADFSFEDSPQIIRRQNGQYILSITAAPNGVETKSVQNEVDQTIDEMHLPTGVTKMQDSMIAMMYDEFQALFHAILIAVFLVFTVMAMQFESPKFSFMVMTCIPFSLIGAFTLLYLTKTSISITSMLGFLMLIGTVVNNGILFVDTVNRYRQSLAINEAIIEAGKFRIRPILMTTLTTVFSMIPMCLGIGEGSEIMKGFAVVAIGGLVASTILCMFVLPTYYILIDKA